MISHLFAVLAIGAIAQAPADRPAPAPPQTLQATPSTAPPFVLLVKGGLNGTVEIRARGVETRAILDRLKEDLKISLFASPLISANKVDLVLKDVPVSRLLLALAPVVLADLEVGADPEDVVWKGINLTGFNEKEPPRSLRQVGFLLAAFNTEDDSLTAEEIRARADKEAARGLEEEPADPDKPLLAVAVADGRVSARSRKQPLIALLNEIAIRANVPFDVQGVVDPVPVDIELRDLPLRELSVALGRPGVRLVVRRSMDTGVEVVQGILLGRAFTPRPIR